MEVGRLQEALRQQKAKVEDLAFELSVEKMHNEDAQARIKSLETTNRALQSDNTQLQNRDEQSKARIAELQSNLDRAQRTIQVQSSQIQGAHNAQRQLTQSSAYHRSDLPYRHPQTRRGFAPRNDPLELENVPPQYPRPANPRQLSAPIKSADSSFTNVLVRSSFDPAMPHFGKIFKDLVDNAEKWVQIFAALPSPEPDRMAHNEIRTLIDGQRLPDLDTILSLTANTETRVQAITKLIMHQIANFALVPLLIRGFKPDYDDRLSTEQQKVFPGVHESIRYESRTQIAAITAEIIADPAWNEHIEQQQTIRVRHCWNVVKPLLDHSTVQKEAWKGLWDLWEQSIKAGLQMLQKISVFDIVFPVAGQDTYFNPANMICMDPQYKNFAPSQLARMQLKVRLAYSPVITERDLELASWQPQSRLFARVLLMK